jgi:ABC-2 type transport system permease protein
VGKVVKKIAKYFAIFRIQLQNRLVYRGDLLAGIISLLVFLWIFIQLWRATYGAMGSGVIAGLTLSQTLWYLMMTESIQMSKSRMSRSISEAVKDGSIAYLLNKPYNFLLYQFSIGLADSLSRFGFNLLFGGALMGLLVSPPPDPRGWPMVLVCVLLALALDFCIQALIGLAAFVSEDVSAFDWIVQKLIFIIGGMLIPIDFFPDWLQRIAAVLPFSYAMYGPARLFVEPTLERFLGVLLGQVVWLGILGLILATAYQRGMRRLSVNGG